MIAGLIKTKIKRNNLWALQSSIKYNWHVFPVASNSKKPLAGSHGKNDATCEINKILGWYSIDPDMNFGYNLERSGLSVIDVDCHGEINGIHTLVKLVTSGIISVDELSRAYIQSTPNNGLHFIYRTSKPFKQMHLGSYGIHGIDLLNQGCSIMCAGSRLGNNRYYICNRIPELEEIGYFPKGLIDYMSELRPERVISVVKTERSKVNVYLPNYSNQGRNNWLTSCAGKLIRCKEINSVYDLYSELNMLNHSLAKPLSDGEVFSIAKSMMRYK